MKSKIDFIAPPEKVKRYLFTSESVTEGHP